MVLFHFILLQYALLGWLCTRWSVSGLGLVVRRSDLPLVWALLTAGIFYGGNIFLGWITGVMSLLVVVAIPFVSIVCFALVCKNQSVLFTLSKMKALFKSLSPGELLLWGMIAVVLASLYAIGLLLPYRVWDAQGYHVQNALSWSMTNRFVLDSFGEPALDEYYGAAQTFSNIKSVLPFVWLECTGSIAGMGTTQFPFLLLLIAAIHSLWRRLDFARWMSPLASLFCLLTPEILVQTTEVYTDVAFFASLISLIALLVFLHQSASKKGFLPLVCVGFMLLTGTKPFGLILAAPFGIIYLVLVFQGTVESNFSRWKKVILNLIAVAAVSICTSGIWNIHAWSQFNNPLYPANLVVGERVVFEGPFDVDVTQRWCEEALGGKTGFVAWWHVMREHNSVVVLSSRENGMGSAVYFLGIPAVLIFAVGCWRERNRFWFVALLFGIVWIFLPNTFLVRMILYQLVVYAIALCWLLERMKWRERTVLLTLLTLCLGLNTARSFPAVLYRTKTPETVAYALLSGHTGWIQHQGFFNDYSPGDFWRDTAAPGEKLAIYMNKPPFYISRTLKSEARFGPRLEPQELTQDWALRLKKEGFTHLLISATKPEFEAVLASPELFEIVLRRRDSSAENPLGYLAPDESVLVRLLP